MSQAFFLNSFDVMNTEIRGRLLSIDTHCTGRIIDQNITLPGSSFFFVCDMGSCCQFPWMLLPWRDYVTMQPNQISILISEAGDSPSVPCHHHLCTPHPLVTITSNLSTEGGPITYWAPTSLVLTFKQRPQTTRQYPLSQSPRAKCGVHGSHTDMKC